MVLDALWRGTWATRIRSVSGLILFVYALLHFLNVAAGLVSPAWMQAIQDGRHFFIRSAMGTIMLYSALLLHVGLSLGKLAMRRSLRMPRTELLQVGLGLLIPFALIEHIFFTRGAHELAGVNDSYRYLIGLIWSTNDAIIQNLLLLAVWVHGCIGLNTWLSGQRWWQTNKNLLTGLAVLVPTLAIVGFVTEGRRLQYVHDLPSGLGALLADHNWPDGVMIGTLLNQASIAFYSFAAILAAVMLTYAVRRYIASRSSVRIRYINGPEVSAPKGMTLLQMSRTAGVPHTSLCGGRGRCTTCRVVIETGQDGLPEPSAAEARSLRAVNASPNTRLACMIKPTAPLAVFRVFRPDGKRARAHASQGEERRLAILFLDMRGFTARTTGQLPYDVVFLLNRFFDAIVPEIEAAGGTIDKYLGDGLLALFETQDAKTSARAALKATERIGAALESFNAQLSKEGATEVRIGIGLHLGDLVVGEIGPVGNAPRTIIGDTVNTASRLEGETKAMGVEVLVSEDLLFAAGAGAVADRLTELTLRGVARPIRAAAMARATDLSAVLETISD